MDEVNLRNTLAPDDVLLFHHIPKTGGLSLISILDQQFPEEEILPLHSAPTTDIWDIYSEEQKSRFRLIRGHFTFIEGDQHIYKNITQKPVRITMIRDPIARVQSDYRYTRRNPIVEVHVKKIIVREGENLPFQNPEDERRRQQALKHSFSQLIQFESHARRMYNAQTRFILGRIPGFPERIGDPYALSEDELFMRAMAILDTFPFVGITEHFDESVQLLCGTFGWPMVEEIPKINVDPGSPDKYQFSEEDLKAAQDFNRIDQRLYNHARQLFIERLHGMRRVFGDK